MITEWDVLQVHDYGRPWSIYSGAFSAPFILDPWDASNDVAKNIPCDQWEAMASLASEMLQT